MHEPPESTNCHTQKKQPNKKQPQNQTKPHSVSVMSSKTQEGWLPASMPCDSTVLTIMCTSAPCNALQRHLSKRHREGHGNGVVPLFVLLQFMPSLTFVILFSLRSRYKQLQKNIWFQSLEPLLLEGLRNARSSDSIRHAGVVLCYLTEIAASCLTGPSIRPTHKPYTDLQSWHAIN